MDYISTNYTPESCSDGTVSDRQVFNIAPETPKGGKCYLFFKRFFDILSASVAGLLLLVPMAVIAILIRVGSPGPVFFTQERLGKNGKKFMICKFRTMVIDAEKDGPIWASKNDDRCTKIGKYLRLLRLDEIPQLWNILKGEMSFVGPRPERECFYLQFEEYIHGFSNRLAVTPGLTGLAQVSGGYELRPEEKIVYDMEYIKTQSLWLDIKLMFRTVKLVITREGAR